MWTKSRSGQPQAARKTRRPIRPKPLMPTRTFMAISGKNESTRHALLPGQALSSIFPSVNILLGEYGSKIVTRGNTPGCLAGSQNHELKEEPGEMRVSECWPVKRSGGRAAAAGLADLADPRLVGLDLRNVAEAIDQALEELGVKRISCGG